MMKLWVEFQLADLVQYVAQDYLLIESHQDQLAKILSVLQICLKFSQIVDLKLLDQLILIFFLEIYLILISEELFCGGLAKIVFTNFSCLSLVNL